MNGRQGNAREITARTSIRGWKIAFAWFACVSAMLTADLSLAQETHTISGVAIEGNRRIDATAVKSLLKASSGVVTEDQISDDVKTLYKTGFFDQVRAAIVTKDSGQIIIRYSVVEKPIVRKVFIKGNSEVKEGDLKDVLKPDNRRFVDAAKVQGMIKAAVQYYQQQGFYDVSFEYSIVPVGDNQVDLTFTVTEGKRYRIRQISIEGLKEIDPSDLRGVMETRRYKWWNSWLLGTGRLNQDMLENDKGLMRQYFLDHGYIDAAVGDPVIDKREDGLYLTFNVTEGREYTIDKITASGDLVNENQKDTLEGIKAKSGDVFSASTLREDTFKISDKFSDKGYAFVNVTPDTTLDKVAAKVKVNYVISKGNIVTINRIHIRGNTKTYDNVVRRELKVDEQEIYSNAKIKRSQKLLERLGYFEEVNITNEPLDANGNPTGADTGGTPSNKDRVDLDVNVREGSTGTFSAGAGYSTSDGPLFNARLAENNIFGTGRSLSLNADVGTQRDSAVLSFDDKRVDDTYLALGADLYRTQRDYSDFDRVLAGGTVTAGYPVEQIFGESFQDIQFSVSYEYVDIDIKNVDTTSAAPLVIQSQGTSTASGFIPKLVHNTINNPLNPTEGAMQSFSIELTGAGGDEKYYLLEGKQQWYYPLEKFSFGDLTFSWRTNVDYGETYNGDNFPLFRRFFPGGINSLRGYKARSLGPEDIRGDAYGGSKEFVNTFELIFPIFNSIGLKGVTFYDSGQAFDDGQPIDVGQFKTDYGFGLRWTSPLGPIRIEFGFPISPDKDESGMKTLFSFGAPL